MPAPFDPYQAWLDIPPQHQPPDHYRLLGVKRFERSGEVIERAAQQRVAALQAHASGPHAEQCRRLLRELSAAQSCLLNEQRRAAYDRALLESAVQEAARPAGHGPGPKASAEQFLDLLDEKDLLPGELLLSLRRRLLEMGGSVPAAKIAQLLVRKGLLTPVLARRLLGAAGAPTGAQAQTPRQGPAVDKPHKPAATGQRTQEPAQPETQPKASSGGRAVEEGAGPAPAQEELGLAPLEEELGLVPLEGEQRAPAAHEAKPPRESPAAGTSPQPPADQAPSARAKTKKTKQPETPKSAAPPAGPSSTDAFGSLLDEELPPLGAEGADAVGDLLSSGAADLATGPGLAPAQPAWAPTRGWSARLRRLRQSRWAWVGAAGVVALLVAVLLIYRVVGARSAAAALPEAEAHFRAGHYAEAVALFDRYLNWHSDQPKAGPARVARVRARLHQLVEQASSPQQTLDAACDMLPPIVGEPAYDDQSAADVALLLGRVAETAIAQGREQQNTAMLDQARSAIELMRRFAPRATQQGNALARLEASLARAAREPARGNQLADALAAFERAAKASDPQAAETALVAVLDRHPELGADERLQRALRSLPEAWQQAAEWVDQPLQPAPTPPPSPVARAVVLCRSQPADAEPDPAAPPVLVALRGAVWALDAATGRVLWQRPLSPAGAQSAVFLPGRAGSDPNASAAAGGSVLLADRLRGELVCVEPSDGRLRWRLALDEPMGLAAASLGGKAVVALQDGKVLAVDPATGTAQGHFQLPAAIELGPTVDAARGLVFQPAHDGRVLFVLDFDEQRCVQAGVLGESAQRLAGPVVVAGDRLLACVNGPQRAGALVVFSISASRGSQRGPLRLLERIPLKGRLAGAPVVGDGDVLVVTDTGRASLFHWEEQGTLKLLLSQDVPGLAGVPCSVRPAGDRLWAARGPLCAYRIERAQKRLALEWIDPAAHTVAALLPAAGENVCCVRRAPNLPGAQVAAVPAAGPLPAEEANWCWKTELGVPALPDSLVQTEGGHCLVASAAGAVFVWEWPGAASPDESETSSARAAQAAARTNTGDVLPQVVDQALAVAEMEGPGRPFQWAVACGDLLVLLARESQAAWILEPENTQAGLRRVWLPGAPACRPVAWGDKLLLASTSGQVWLFDPRAGWAAAAPFQASFTLEAMPAMNGLAAVGEGEAVLCDARGRLYVLRMEPQPVPHVAGAQIAAEARIVSSLTAAGKSAFGVDQSGRLVRFEAPELVSIATSVPPVQPTWGPVGAGGRIWLADAKGRVACVSGAGELLWQVTLEGGPPQGVPLVEDQSVWLATADGAVVRLALETGEAIGRAETGRALTSGVLRCGDRLVVCTADGALVEVSLR